MKRRDLASALVPGSLGQVANWGATSLIKSIQRGTVNGGATATITAVVVANSRLRYLGRHSNNDTQDLDTGSLTFTNSTTITCNVNTGGGGVVVSFEVTEYMPGVVKSVQRATVGAQTTATITAVNTAKSELDWLGSTTTSATTGDQAVSSLVLTNGTTVTSTGGGGLTVTNSFQVIEFY